MNNPEWESGAPYAAASNWRDAQLGESGLTPIETHYIKNVPILVKRDDLFEIAGVRGGKARTCWHLAYETDNWSGLVTAGSRASPQINIVARIAYALEIPCRAHCPTGELGPELLEAQEYGAEIIQHEAGYNNVIIARAREDARSRVNWQEIPFGMECQEAVSLTSNQVRGIPKGAKRIVMAVGSGMTLAGVLRGMCTSWHEPGIPIVGVVVGADPSKRLNKWAPWNWREVVSLVASGMDYHKAYPRPHELGFPLDPIYEAKCLPFLKGGDLFWVTGIRNTATKS